MNEDLQQHLMEFVYGLLDEDEANALGERITSDPQVARAYATVKLQCELVARVARYDATAVAWNRPNGAAPSNAKVQSAPTASSAVARRRLANWCIALAACGLIGLVGSASWMSWRTTDSESTPVAFASTVPLQVVLTGPSKLNAEASNPFTIQVKNQAGTPVSAAMNYRVYDDRGRVSWEQVASTNESGVARFDVEAPVARDASHLEIAAADGSLVPIRHALEAAPEHFVAYLRMDRPLFQPGESVWYRSVTLSRFGLRAEREVKTSYVIVNSNDEPLARSSSTVQTDHGVGSGEFELPSDLPDGKYTLIARSPDNLFREEWRDFQVRRYQAPQLLKELELAKDSYTAGDQVEVDFQVKRAAGEPLAARQLQIQLTLDGAALAAPQATTDAEGKSRFLLDLPESIDRGEARVSVSVRDGDKPAETISKEIPINLGKVNVDFYPEGGDLVEDLPNRVYFYGRDPLGKPTHIEGRIVDSNGDEVAEVVTGHEGRGVFSFTPSAIARYRLLIDKPVDVMKELPLPATSPLRYATIDTGEGVFGANAPLAFTVRQRTPAKPLIVAAYCRGAMVAQQTIESDAYITEEAAPATFRGEMDLPPAAQGVIRLTVFDPSSTPPAPIAERLVYRRVGQRLSVNIQPDAETFAPNQAVELKVQIHDENDVPVPAVLGIAIVDDAILNLADDKSVRMPTYFHLLTEIDSPEQLEDANFYLSESPESVAALDSLLGTQGWRRFTELPEMQLAQAGGGALGGGSGGGLGGGGFGVSFDDGARTSLFRSLAWTDDSAVPISTAATMDVETMEARQSIRPASVNAAVLSSFALPMIVASIALLALVVGASLPGVQGSRSLRVSAAAVALASLLVGVLNLPKEFNRVAQVTDSVAPAAARTSEQSGRQNAADVAGVAAELEEADASGSADNVEAFSKRPQSFEMAEPAPSAQPAPASGAADAPAVDSIAAEGAARFAAPERESRRMAQALDDKMIASKEKQAATSSPEPSSPADASKPQPSALVGKDSALDEQLWIAAAKNETATREYAKWFYRAALGISPTGESPSESVWDPLHIADLKDGEASIFFNLPPRPTSLRAIVEAHGDGRLGAGELLIESR